jgi:hypothetical protein
MSRMDQMRPGFVILAASGCAMYAGGMLAVMASALSVAAAARL